MELWKEFVDWIWTPTVAQLVTVGFYGWIISLAIAACLKLVLRRVKLNARLNEVTIDLEDRIADGVYWSGIACTVVIALYGALA